MEASLASVQPSPVGIVRSPDTPPLALCLDDTALTKLFLQFNRERDGAGLTVDEQLARLRAAGCPMR